MLAPLNRRSEDVIVEPIVVAELKLRNVQRKIFGAHVLASQSSSTFTRSDISQSLSVIPAAFAGVPFPLVSLPGLTRQSMRQRCKNKFTYGSSLGDSS